MADIRLKILAEMENIESVLAHLPGKDKLHTLSALELAGVAALLHSFYNGVENILKQTVAAKGIQIVDGATWHRDLLDTAVSAGILSLGTKNDLRGYLAFRHFFSHGYAADLEPERLEELVEDVPRIYSLFKNELRAMFQLEN